MELNLECIVSHGIGWNGGVREYCGNITVELLENEYILLKKFLQNSDSRRTSVELESEFPAIYKKIEECSRDYKFYTFVLDTCVHWNTEYGDIREEDLIEEDIKSGRFKPLYTNAEGSSRDLLIMNQWFCWLINEIAGLSYKERTAYLVNRYKMELPPYEEIEFEQTYKISQP